jgi:hypothetical protein
MSMLALPFQKAFSTLVDLSLLLEIIIIHLPPLYPTPCILSLVIDNNRYQARRIAIDLFKVLTVDTNINLQYL